MGLWGPGFCTAVKRPTSHRWKPKSVLSPVLNLAFRVQAQVQDTCVSLTMLFELWCNCTIEMVFYMFLAFFVLFFGISTEFFKAGVSNVLELGISLTPLISSCGLLLTRPAVLQTPLVPSQLVLPPGHYVGQTFTKTSQMAPNSVVQIKLVHCWPQLYTVRREGKISLWSFFFCFLVMD